MVSPPRSQLRRKAWYTALFVSSIVLLSWPQAPDARVLVPATDTTPPVVTYTIDGILGNHDWYRGSAGGNFIVVRWSVSDPESPIISTSGCEPAIQINGPNTGTTRTCSATSDGGTTTVTTRLLKIDATPPANLQASAVRPPDHNGWYNQAVNINWGGTDATSGIDSCTSRTYSGPDSGSGSTSGTCTDMAGNVSVAFPFTLAYDGTNPNASSAVPARPPDDSGWYNHSVGITWSGNDATSGIDSCTVRTYTGPDVDGGTTTGTCTDEAGNTSTPLGFGISYDDTAPVVTVSPARPTDHNGWYNHAVGITWSGSDATSGVDSCTSRTYSSPDVANGSTSGTCTDRAGNVSTALAFPLSYDSTSPVVNVAPARGPDRNGWYNQSVGLTWSGTDATSGVDTCSGPSAYNGPDSATARATGTCTDEAGNVGSGVFSLSYDATRPNATDADAARTPDRNGWYNHAVAITWSGTDATSGVESCTSRTYSGPDVDNGTSSGTCSDRAGNTSTPLGFGLSYDATRPAVSGTQARSPDHNGWYNHAVAITWNGTDAMSGIDSCTTRTYSGPDVASGSTSGTCTDRAGNNSANSLAFPLSYDATDPVVAVTADRNADHAGWYNRPVGISWSGTDATSGIDSCSAPITYSGPDSANASSVGGCTDEAGNSASPPPLSFRYDATAPVTGVAPGRAADANDWYNHALRISWAGSDPTSGISSCTSVLYSGPDAGSVARTGVCTDQAGNASPPSTFRFRYDATAPGGVGVTPARPPDHDGWYNHPLAIRWFASDLLAGLASCTSLTYGGPNETGGRLTGLCTDRAGNRSATLPFVLRYDEDAPALTALSLKGLDDAVALRWRVAGASELQITRSAGSGNAAAKDVYSGTGSAFTDRNVQNYVRYRYTLTAEDPAGNTVRRTASVMPLPVLYAPRGGAHLRVHARPLFAWKPAKRARYYNFQLWVDGHQVGSWWPARARLRLPARWSHNGQAQRLERGTYTWYVWPGRGPRKLGRFGALLGKSSFVVG